MNVRIHKAVYFISGRGTIDSFICTGKYTYSLYEIHNVYLIAKHPVLEFIDLEQNMYYS